VSSVRPPVGGRPFSFTILRMHRRSLLVRITFCALLVFVFTSCSTPSGNPTSTSIPSTSTFLPFTPTPKPTATSTPVPAPQRAQYAMNVVLTYAAKSVAVDETIIYPNHTGQALNSLVLAVEPNYWPNCFTLGSLNLNGVQLSTYTLNSHKLTIQLPTVLAPEATGTLQIQYSLNLPQIEPTNPNLSRPRIFGFTSHQINLTNWYPFVVPFSGGQWVLHDAWYYGEHLVYDAADYTVNIKSSDPAVTPIIAASGAPSPNGEWTRYSLTSGRTFAISASTEFATASVQALNANVTSYYFPIYAGAGKAALNAAAQALQIYSQRYGPYSHQTLAIVMGDFNDGMEFSGFYFLSRGFYNLYTGGMNNFLIDVAAHETAHQWWFEQVADDQALQPWLDEAMATYSEHVFYETASPASLNQWWWPVRIDLSGPKGWVDTPIYNAGSNPQYWNAVYFQGAHFLEDLRTRIGDPSFFAFLQDYLKQENGQIATTADFFRILRLHTGVDISDLVRKYFQNTY
jgi:Peptidase family M1 domain